MSKQILDSSYKGDFSIFFEKGEIILWEGSPQKESIHEKRSVIVPKRQTLTWEFIIRSILIFVFGSLALYIALPPILEIPIFYFILFLIPIIIFSLPFILISNSPSRVRYYITQNRIIIKPSKRNKKSIHIINLDDVINFTISKLVHTGTIELQIKDQPTSEIFIRKFKDGKSGIYARLENIENPEIVLELLKKYKEI